MVTILPKENDWSEAFQQIGSGLSSGYMNRSDEMAIQKAVSSLPPDATQRQILDAVTGAKTYGAAAKQNFLKNQLGAAQFDELKRHAMAVEEETKAKREAEQAAKESKKVIEDLEKKAKKAQEKSSAAALIDLSNLPEDQKVDLKQRVENDEILHEDVRQLTKPNKELTKTQKEEESQETTQKAFNRLAELIPEVGRSGIPASYLGGDTSKSFAEFTSLTGALEALLVEKVNRGTLSNTRFEYITKTLLPKPSDTQAEIEGKLTGLATILELDSTALTGGKTKKKPSLSSFKKG